MIQIAQCRLEGDHDKDKALIAEMSKLIANSSYSQMITNKEKPHDIVYISESEISTKSWTIISKTWLLRSRKDQKEN